MEKQFVTYEIALKLKELGFDEPCLSMFDHSEKILHGYQSHGKIIFDNSMGEDYNANGSRIFKCAAPLWQQAIDFIFKKLDETYPYLKLEIFSDTSGCWYHSENRGMGIKELDIDFDNLEEAILKVLELIK